MWILCENGVAINTDMVGRFRQDGCRVIADIPGLPVSTTTVGETTVEELVRFICSDLPNGEAL